MVYFQAQYDIRTQTAYGLEALIRCQHRVEGPLSPDRFIPLAEETKLIIPIGEIVLRAVCKDAVRWRNEGVFNGWIVVNVSGVQIKRFDFAQTIKNTA